MLDFIFDFPEYINDQKHAQTPLGTAYALWDHQFIGHSHIYISTSVGLRWRSELKPPGTFAQCSTDELAVSTDRSGRSTLNQRF